MAPKKTAVRSSKKVTNKGAWTAEEDMKLSQYIEVHGAKRWKTIAVKAGLNRCGKSCRLRWLNYLRPNIKRGNISDEEEDLILRLHKLLGNRWSLIAGRIPGRTDNEIKNYWNSHLSKKPDKSKLPTLAKESLSPPNPPDKIKTCSSNEDQIINDNSDAQKAVMANSDINFDASDFFDFSIEGSYGLDWVEKFLELDGQSWLSDKR